MASFGCTLHTVTTEREIPLAFRIEVTRRREQLGLTIREAARRTNIAGPRSGISESRWGHIERGYESKGSVRIPANPRRSTIIKMATALHWPIKAALECAGEIEPTKAEVAQTARNSRRELDVILDQLSESQLWALYQHLRTMLDPNAPPADHPAADDPDDQVIILGPHETIENHHTERDGTGKSRQT